jgi:hypothetical protein
LNTDNTTDNQSDTLFNKKLCAVKKKNNSGLFSQNSPLGLPKTILLLYKFLGDDFAKVVTIEASKKVVFNQRIELLPD